MMNERGLAALTSTPAVWLPLFRPQGRKRSCNTGIIAPPVHSPGPPEPKALLGADDEDKEDRHEEDGQQGAADHAAEYAGADSMLGLRAGAAGEHQRHHA